MELTGVSNIMVTPFAADGAVDFASISQVTRWAVDAGADSLVPLGIMGEVQKLTDAERGKVVEAVSSAAKDVPVIAGCTSESTVLTLERIRQAKDHGARAAMVAPPRAATSRELQLQHYLTIAEADVLPIVVQDEPVTTGVRLAAAVIGEVGAHANVLGVKVEEVPSPTKVSAILAANPEVSCLGGLGGLYMLEELDRGATGIMTGFGYPEVLVSIWRAYRSGDRAKAQDLFFRHLPLIRYEAQLGIGGVTIRKLLLAERGVIATPALRGPAAPADPRTITELRELVSAVTSE